MRRAATHYYLRAWQNVNTQKRLLYRHCYIPSFPAQVFMIQSQNNVSLSLAEGLSGCNILFCFVDAIFDLVHDVETIHGLC